MRLEQLQYLITIIEHHSINAAANALHMTQQSLSNSMQSLEQELNTQILDRNHRGVCLTKNGEIVYQTSLQMLSMWQDMRSRFSFQADDTAFKDSLRILSTSRTIDHLILSPFQAYKKRYPASMAICDDESYKTILTGNFDASYYDLIITTLFFENKKLLDYKPPKGTVFIPLYEYKPLIVAHRSSSISSLKYITPAHLRKLPLRIYEPKAWTDRDADILQYYYRHLGLSAKNIRHSDSIAFCIQGVLDNLFYVSCPEGSQSKLFIHPDIVFIPVRNPIKVVAGYFLPEGHKLSESALKFIDVFQTVYQTKGIEV